MYQPSHLLYSRSRGAFLLWLLTILDQTGEPILIDFKFHDFGARGVSSMESAGRGGAARLVHFMGTDTNTGVLCDREYYSADVSEFSGPAAEFQQHGTYQPVRIWSIE